MRYIFIILFGLFSCTHVKDKEVLNTELKTYIDSIVKVEIQARTPLTASATTWASISGKPATYPSTWATVSGKPATFAPTAHTHKYTDITGVSYKRLKDVK